MNEVRTITPTIARRLAISRQRLADPQPAPDRDGLLAIFRDLGSVQIDPIRAVERTQLLVLWSRLGAFKLADLDALLWQERQLFEFWAHAASIVLTEDYPLHSIFMREWLAGGSQWQTETLDWLATNAELQRHILSELEHNGPLTSRDFQDHSERAWESSGWTAGQNVTQMLRIMWRMGRLMVSGRQRLTKYWDLTERCLPAWTPQEELLWPDVVYAAAQRSLRALGVARQDHISDHFTRGRYPDLAGTLAKLEQDGRIMPVRIAENGAGWPGDWYLHVEDLPLLERLEQGEWRPRTTLLSPFDNLICDRDRTELLFDFFFRIEIYVPAAKRQYGYYVLPILHGDRLIGRIDPRYDRKQKKLLVNAVYAEPDAPDSAETGAALATAIADLAAFLGAKDIVYGDELPIPWRPALR